jgi:glucose/arabinose dehydrogenase
MKASRLKRAWLTLAIACAFLSVTSIRAGFPAAAAENPSGMEDSLQAGTPSIALDVIAEGFARPVYVTHAGDGSGRLFVVEQKGKIWVVEGGIVLPEPFLDLHTIVSQDAGEEGLLGLAFHPEYDSNGFFYVDYTTPRPGAETYIVRYEVSEDPNVADPSSAQTLLNFSQPYQNHNAGMLAFGPDGYLYIAVGDGGGTGDPDGNGQNTANYLGNILRIDVDSGTPYAIPIDNPDLGPSALPEIWSFGFRNPWRFSFDRSTGDLYIGDVGQFAYEEIDYQESGDPGGHNYGWNVVEGDGHCYEPPTGCDQTGKTLPVFEYEHTDGNCSVTGGYVYRGGQFDDLLGIYVYGDYCTGRIWGLEQTGPGLWSNAELKDTPEYISSFGEDEVGELYLTSLYNGRLFWLRDESSTVPGNDDFDSAVGIGSLPFQDALFTGLATTAGDDPIVSCGAVAPGQQSHSVWYEYTPTSDSVIEVSTLGSNFDTVIAVWTGTRGSLVNTACNDSGDGLGGTAYTAFIAQAGTTYHIEVTSRGSSNGELLSLAIVERAYTFDDVPTTHQFWTEVEALFDAGITQGCSVSPLLYCPDSDVSRAQMAKFLLIAEHGEGYDPPTGTGTMFDDVPSGHLFVDWIEQLANEGITSGCSVTPPLYCPELPVSRAQMSKFLLVSEHGTGYVPPVGTGTLFDDVPLSHPFVDWIEQLANEGITSGCGGGNYCPDYAVSRGQMAKFLVLTFALPTP